MDKTPKPVGRILEGLPIAAATQSRVRQRQIDAAVPDDSPSKPQIPEGLSALISSALAIEAEEAQDAGALGFMARAMTMASLPHSRVAGTEFERRNGKYTLSIVAHSRIGLPYGAMPRLLLAWLTTEAVRTQSRRLVLGNSLSAFMRQLGLTHTGGANGSSNRVKDQARRLFNATITASYEDAGRTADMGWRIAERALLWWEARDPGQRSLFESEVMLTEPFYDEVTTSPVAIDMRALGAVRNSPLAIDCYCWLTFRMSYLRQPTVIPWTALLGQFGAGYPQTPRGLRAFREHFLRALRRVLAVYDGAKITPSADGVLLAPGHPHVRKLSGR